MPTNLFRPNAARIVDYYLGGDHHYAVDRRVAKQWEVDYPQLARAERFQRQFLNRAVTYLIWKRNIHNFLGFHSGLPAQGNLHEIALFHIPRAHVIYSDDDAQIVDYGQRFLLSSGLEKVQYVRASIAEPEPVLDHAAAGELLAEPVAAAMLSQTHCVPGETLARTVRTIYDRVVSGSHLLFIFIDSDDILTFPDLLEKLRAVAPFYVHSESDILDLLQPWQVTPHGICYLDCWPYNCEPETGVRLGSALLAYKP